MAASNLYPPLIASTLPAFVYSQEIYDIPFSVSQYNAPSEISKWIQISVVNPNTGQSMLNTKYPNGIITVPANNLTNFNSLQQTLNSVKLDGGDLLEDVSRESLNDLIGQTLKIQLRFCSSSLVVPSPVSQAWLAQNIDQFSEWSKSALVMIISKPSFLIENKKLVLTDAIEGIYKYTDSLLKFNGVMNFLKLNQDNEEVLDTTLNEKLVSYRLQLYQGKKLIEDSKTISAKNNEFNYVFRKKVLDKINYELHFSYITSHGYSNTLVYYIVVELQEGQPSHISFVNVEENSAVGGVNITLTLSYDKTEPELFNNPKILQIRRSDNFCNYEYWDVIHYIEIPLVGLEKIDYQWIDYTVDAGYWYRYEIREIFKIDENTLQPLTFGKPSITDDILIDFDEIYFNTIESSLKINLDAEISNYKYITQESITNTIGSQFPFIRRNGNVNYKQFSLKGLLTCAIEDEQAFLNYENKYGFYNSYYNSWKQYNNISTLYDQYPIVSSALSAITANTTTETLQTILTKDIQDLDNYLKKHTNKNILWTDDYLWERFFREQVEKFLCNGKPKLFRSATEGNVLVFLNNVSFTPNKTLGRRIYEFSAQCTQIAEATVQNLKKYGIIENDLQEVNYRYILDTERYDPDSSRVLITKGVNAPIMQDSSNKIKTEVYSCEFGTMKDLLAYHTVFGHSSIYDNSNIVPAGSHKITINKTGMISEIPTYTILLSREILSLDKKKVVEEQ